jgi:hypothetical protein
VQALNLQAAGQKTLTCQVGALREAHAYEDRWAATTAATRLQDHHRNRPGTGKLQVRLLVAFGLAMNEFRFG